MHNGYLHIAVLIALSQLALAQQPTIDIWIAPATELDALPGHALDHDEINFVNFFTNGCPTSVGGCSLSQECGTTEVYYVWGKFTSGANNGTITGLHLVAGASGQSVIEDSVIYRHRYDDGSWDRWDSSAPIVMHGDPALVGYATAGTGNGIKNTGTPNPYDLYCNATHTFLIGAIRLNCPIPCPGTGLQLGIGGSGFQVLNSSGGDISATVQLRLCGQTTSNPPPGGLPFWTTVVTCQGGFTDCNNNGIPDACDVSCTGPGCEGVPGCGGSDDCDNNGQPDECQPELVSVTITEQPASQTVCVGQSVTFTATAEGNPTPYYQWRKDGHDIPGATNSSYTIAWADPLDAGDYSVRASGCGTAYSLDATLTVVEKPFITLPPMEQTITAGGDADFSVTAAGGGTYSYQWRRAAVPLSDGPYVNSTTTAALTIQRVDAADTGWYDVVVTNECGYVVSPHAFLTVNPGPCPPRGAPYVTKTYLLTGNANNTPWSWRIESTDGKFTDAVELHVHGVAEGGATAVAQRFAESINAYAAAHGRGADQLYAIGREAFGQTLFAIRTGGSAAFRLWVGPADQEPSCLVVPEQLPACGFNPTITALPDEVLRQPTQELAPQVESPAPATTPLSGGGIVKYDLRTKEATRYPTAAGSARPLNGILGPAPDAAPLSDPPAPSVRGRGLTLTPVDDPNAYRYVCKIYYTQLGEDYVATGSFIDPKHILTSGMVVNTGGDWVWGRGWVDGEWSTHVTVVPRYVGGTGSWPAFHAVRLWSFGDFVSRGDTQDMLGVIVLNRPVVPRTACTGVGYLDYLICYDYPSEWDFNATIAGYPEEEPYADGRLYTGTVELQMCGWDRFDARSYYGLRGAPVVQAEHYGDWVHAWDDGSAPTRLVPLRERHYDAIYQDIDDDRPDAPDLVPFQLEVEGWDFMVGDDLNVKFRIINYSDANTPVVWVGYQVYLSRGPVIGHSSVLLYESGWSGWWAAMYTHSLDLSGAPVSIPENVPSADYWVIVRVVYDDAGPDNNDTNGEAAVQITVTCGEVPAPTGVRATDGTYNSHIAVSWDPVPGTSVVYDLYRDDDPDLSGGPYQTNLTAASFDDYDVVPGQTYYYWVQAHNACGHWSPLSDADTGWRSFMSAPLVLASNGTDLDHVVVTWTSVYGAQGYRIRRVKSESDPNLVTIYEEPNDPTTLTCVDNYLPAPDVGRRYDYFAQALGSPGVESGLSYGDVGWVGVPPPSNVTATDGDSEYNPQSVFVDWEFPGLSWYYFQVYRAPLLAPTMMRSITPWTRGTDPYDTDVYDTTAVPGVDYAYSVRASYYADGSCPSEPSTPDPGWRLLNPPTNVTATDGTWAHEVVITWNAPPGGVRFQVWRGTSADPNDAHVISIPDNDPSAWISETGWGDATAVPGVEYYYWVAACGGHWCSHMTELSTPGTGWRAFDCNGNGMPDHMDPNAIAPPIAAQPLDQAACLGTSVAFTVQSQFTSDVSYTWRHDGVPLGEPNSPSLVLPWIDPTDAGTYDVILTNGCGSTTSTPATLTVLMPVTIVQQPPSWPIIVEIGGSAGFSVSATGAAPLTYQWRHGTVPLVDGTDVWGGVIAGAQTPNLAIANVQTQHAGPYDVVITNPCGQVTSLPGQLAVELPPGPPAGATFMASTYEIVGAGEGQDWSWRIDSALGRFTSTPAVTAPGVTGTALDVAQAFAASINDYVQSQGWPPGALAAAATEIAGTVSLALRSSADEPLVLYVGPAGGPADARVELPLPPCEFNPLIVQLPLPGADCNANRQDDLLDLLTSASTDVNLNSRPDECESIGDTNCDGLVSYADVGPFVIVLNSLAAYEAQYPECNWHNADVNGDGKVSYGDINPFVRLLGGE